MKLIIFILIVLIIAALLIRIILRSEPPRESWRLNFLRKR